MGSLKNYTFSYFLKTLLNAPVIMSLELTLSSSTEAIYGT